MVKSKIANAEKAKKVKFVIKKKPIDPLKVNAVQVLQKIAFSKLEDRFLMNNDDIEKDETVKIFLGFDNPTTCQLNLNYLYCKAISALEKRLSNVEKQLRVLCPTEKVSGSKRKRVDDIVKGTEDVHVSSETIDLDGEVTNDGFQNEVCKENEEGKAEPVEMSTE